MGGEPIYYNFKKVVYWFGMFIYFTICIAY